MNPWNSLEEYKNGVRLFCLGWMILLGLVAVFGVAIVHGEDVPRDPAIAHQWADGILGPEFDAAYNRFRATHPVDKKAGTWDHVHTVNVEDKSRWAQVEQRFEALQRAMRRAGY
jgi:hypothetical protein